jgi:hypothetical protein
MRAPNRCGLKIVASFAEKDTYGFGVAQLLPDPNLSHGAGPLCKPIRPLRMKASQTVCRL